MNLPRYLITLLAVPMLFFSAKAYSHNIAESKDYKELRAGRAFLIVDKRADGQIIEERGFSKSNEIREILDDMQIMYYQEDKTSVFPSLFMEMGAKITIERAPKINLYDGKKYQLVRSWSATIEDLFRERDIILGMEDKTTLPLETPIEDNMEIKISRVAKTVIVESEEIAYKKLKKDDPNLKYGLTRVEGGSMGQREMKYLVTRVDGEEVSRVLLENKTITEAKDEITYTGTKIVVLSSERGFATLTKASDSYVVSGTYPRGTLIRITNKANGKSIIVKVNATWGTENPPQGVVLDLSETFLYQLGWDRITKGPYVSVEEIEQ